MKNILLLFSALMFAIPFTVVAQTVLLSVKDDPTISFRIVFNAGSQNDPKGKEGLAYITARMISEGATKNNTYEAILEKLFPLAASYNVSAGVEQTVMYGRVHRDNLTQYYSLFMDALLKPVFSEADFRRIKDETLNYLTTTLKYSSDEELGKAVLYNSIFEGTGYGHIPQGTISGVNSITIQDIKEFYEKHYTRNNFTLGLAGGYSDELVKQVEGDLKKLPDIQYTPVSKPSVKKIEGLNVTVINKDANATAVSFGFPINVTRGSREWYALAIANSWFGEHRNSSSHLYQVIREARGLNYGDYSYIENFPYGGQLQMPPVNVGRRQQIFEVWIRPVPNETGHFSLRAAARELRKLVDNGMSREDFDLTRNFLYKYSLHYAPDTDTRLGYALDDKFYGIQGSHLELFRKMMKEITLEEVNSAIRKYLQYDNMSIAVITKGADEFKRNLVENTASPITYSTPKPQDVMEEDKVIQDYKLKVSPEKVSVVNVEELFK